MNPTIICSVCQVPVDSFEWWDDMMTNDRHIVAKCHGAKDEMILTEDDLWRMVKNNSFPSVGHAFITTMLMPSPTRAGSSTVAALPSCDAR